MRTNTGSRRYWAATAAIMATIGVGLARPGWAATVNGMPDATATDSDNTPAVANGEDGFGGNAEADGISGTGQATATGGMGANNSTPDETAQVGGAATASSTAGSDGSAGAHATGGAGGNGVGSGGTGGTATATATGVSSATATASGGDGGEGGDSDGIGGAASATATAMSNTTSASATATAIQGQNGGHTASPNDGLFAGNIATATANSTVSDASVTISITAGSAGDQVGSGGAGGSVAVDTPYIISSPTHISINQTARAGNGGGDAEVAGIGPVTPGAGGNATSTIGLNDTGTASVTANVNAIAGNSGFTFLTAGPGVGVIGGSAAATAVLTATNTLDVTISSTGGIGDAIDGGFSGTGGEGGAATVSGAITSTGGKDITITASAVAGAGGSGDIGGIGGQASFGVISANAPIYANTSGSGNITISGTITSGHGGSVGSPSTALSETTIAGNGGAASAINALDGNTGSNGSISLTQQAFGGHGGGAESDSGTAMAGNGGDALSNLTYTKDVLSLSLFTVAGAGAGGDSNGDFGSIAGSGGNAVAISTAINTSTDPSAVAIADADARGNSAGSALGSGIDGLPGLLDAEVFASVNGITVFQELFGSGLTEEHAHVEASISLADGSTRMATRMTMGANSTPLSPAAFTHSSGMYSISDNLAIGSTTATSGGTTGTYFLQGGTLSTGSTTIYTTGVFNQSGGNASLGNVSGNGTITLSNGSLIAATLSMPSGHVSANGTLTFSPTSATRQTPDVAIEIGNLTVGTAGLIDLTNHDLIIHGGETLSQVEALIVDGYDSGTWAGTHGITSSTAASTPGTGLGYATAGELGISTFDGISVTSTDILVKYTYIGDANLDGEVNGFDLVALAHNFGASPADWSQGDFNYNGVVEGGDVGLYSTYVNSGTGGADGSPLAIVATPEPGSLAMLGVTSLVLLRRRKPSRA
jgi:hypothetical protein